MNAAQHTLIFAVHVYRWVISPANALLFGPLSRCRFTPSCSTYALEAVARHGALAGSWLALKRIGRCHPWGGCGDDPVPPVRSAARSPGFSRFPLQYPEPRARPAPADTISPVPNVKAERSPS
jgi:uncharacterized protein